MDKENPTCTWWKKSMPEMTIKQRYKISTEYIRYT